MTVREQIARLFKIARQEGVLRCFADGLEDADELLDLRDEQGNKVLLEQGEIEEEADLVGRLIARGWIPPEEAKSYVKRDPDQSLPDVYSGFSMDGIIQPLLRKMQRDILNAGFVKCEPSPQKGGKMPKCRVCNDTGKVIARHPDYPAESLEIECPMCPVQSKPD